MKILLPYLSTYGQQISSLLVTNLPPDFLGGFLSLSHQQQGIIIAWVNSADTNAEESGEGRC